MIVLGLSAFYHDSAAAIVRDSVVVAAQQERFSRKKNDLAFPADAAAIARKAKPGGIVMVGLYNSYARVPTWARSKVIGMTDGNIDYVVRNRIKDTRKAEIWIKDQYYNPHETWHSIGEVLEWFGENGVDYLNCSPAILGTDGEDAKNGGSLFQPTRPGSAYQRVVTQLSWIGTIARKGALFDVIGRKK